MKCESELSFLREVFRRCRIHTEITAPGVLASRFLGKDRAAERDALVSPEEALAQAISDMAPRTLYRLTDSFERWYACLLLPCAGEPSVLVIGPMLAAPLSPRQLLMIGERNGISPQKQRYLHEYFSSIPILSADSPLSVMLNSLCERLWESPAFSIVNIVGKTGTLDVRTERSMQGQGLGDMLVNMQAVEKRYGFENELMRAVSLGQLHMEEHLFKTFTGEFFERRVSDPLRNAKNYAIILNTLLRKAAERGGVHPVHLDETSSLLAAKIEKLVSQSGHADLMREMFRTYCRLVRKHSLSSFSMLVQRAIVLIEGDLSADVSPGSLARALDVSLGYLCSVFKKETGKTVSEYTRERRMEYAKYLLSTSELQVQTVALHCGIMDAQYFSKMFKRCTGKTPNEFRSASSGASEK